MIDSSLLSTQEDGLFRFIHDTLQSYFEGLYIENRWADSKDPRTIDTLIFGDIPTATWGFKGTALQKSKEHALEFCLPDMPEYLPHFFKSILCYYKRAEKQNSPGFPPRYNLLLKDLLFAANLFRKIPHDDHHAEISEVEQVLEEQFNMAEPPSPANPDYLNAFKREHIQIALDSIRQKEVISRSDFTCEDLVEKLKSAGSILEVSKLTALGSTLHIPDLEYFLESDHVQLMAFGVAYALGHRLTKYYPLLRRIHMKAADKDETYQNYFALMRLYYAGSDFDQADTTAEYLAGDILRCLESSGRELKSYYAARLVTLSQIMVDSFNDEGISLLSQTAAKVPNSPLNGFVDTVIANKTGLSLQRGIGLLRKTFPDSANSYTTLLQFMRGIRFISNNDRDFAVAELQAKPTNTVYCRAIQQAYLME